MIITRWVGCCSVWTMSGRTPNAATHPVQLSLLEQVGVHDHPASDHDSTLILILNPLFLQATTWPESWGGGRAIVVARTHCHSSGWNNLDNDDDGHHYSSLSQYQQIIHHHIIWSFSTWSYLHIILSHIHIVTSSYDHHHHHIITIIITIIIISTETW